MSNEKHGPKHMAKIAKAKKPVAPAVVEIVGDVDEEVEA